MFASWTAQVSHAYILGVYNTFQNFSLRKYKFSGKLRILDTKYSARGRKNFPAKKLIYIYIYIYIYTPVSIPLGSVSYQMSLLILEPGGLELPNLGFAGPSFYPLHQEGFVKRIISVADFPD